MVLLNKAQEAAVTASDGPVLVLAGAGSGKTRVIVERLAWLVEEQGVDPRYLLALTFTNKAAAEMRQRFAKRLEMDRVSTWLGTFHSFGLYLLRREMAVLGRSKSFSVFDDSDQIALMKRLVKGLSSQYASVSPREALHWVSSLKQQVETPDFEAEKLSPEEKTYHMLWRQYHAALEQASAVDFDDLLVLSVKLLQDFPEVRAKYQRRYRYVHVDEYQDTNRAQYLVARLLSEGHGNIFVVGDEDQSIYSWRGADINNILDFADDFPEAQVYRLEENYRSVQPILDAANAVVAHNVNRLGKKLFTKRVKGEPVRWFRAEDAEIEARFVAQDIGKRELSPHEVAVLFRTNGQARLLEDALRRVNVPYVVVGGIRFYSRKEIKDILCYLRLLVNPEDDESLRRVINVPTRGIGGVTLARLEETAEARKTSLFQVLRDVESDESLSPRARRAAMRFVTLIDDLTLAAKSKPLAELVEQLLEDTGYRDYVEESDEKDFRSRLDVVDEFVVACEQHDKQSGTGLLAFLQDLALVSDVDGWDDSLPAVTLMTCHAAKGLEFPHVYLVGLEEGLLPYGVDLDEERDVEEERRLCYVAMTRACVSLTLTAASARMLYGRTQYDREISRFVQEIGVNRLQAVGKKAERKKKASASSPSAQPVDEGAVKMGTRVRHARFGMGTVLFCKKSGGKTRVRVRFDSGRSALLQLDVAPLEILKEKRR